MPRFLADRTLPASVDDVWALLADPYSLGRWWPGIAGVEPDRRGLAPGARWSIVGPSKPSLLRKPEMTGGLVVLAVAPGRRLAFQLTTDRIEADLTLHAVDEASTSVSLVVDAPWLIGIRRTFPAKALARLAALVRDADV